MNPLLTLLSGATFRIEKLPGLVSLWFAKDPALVVGDPCSEWTDCEGSNDLAQATAGKRPDVATDSGTGRKVCTFDGIDDVMTCTLAAPIAGNLSATATITIL